MKIKCPHCGFVDVVSDNYLGCVGYCENCGVEYLVSARQIVKERHYHLPGAIILFSVLGLLIWCGYGFVGKDIIAHMRLTLADLKQEPKPYKNMQWRPFDCMGTLSSWHISTDEPSNLDFIAYYASGRLEGVRMLNPPPGQTRDEGLCKKVVEYYKKNYFLEGSWK